MMFLQRISSTLSYRRTEENKRDKTFTIRTTNVHNFAVAVGLSVIRMGSIYQDLRLHENDSNLYSKNFPTLSLKVGVAYAFRWTSR